MKKKIFSKAVRRMKLKLYLHAYDINLYKVCVFFILIASNELSVRCATGSHQFTTLLSILIRISKKKKKKKKKKSRSNSNVYPRSMF